MATCAVLFGFEKNTHGSAGTMDFVMKQALGGKYSTVSSMNLNLSGLHVEKKSSVEDGLTL